MKSFKIILFIVIVSFVLAFLVPASIKKAYIPYFAIPYVNQYTFQIIDLLPKNVESSKFTRKLVDTFIIWVDREVSDLEIERKKYEIDNVAAAQWLEFPKGINLWKIGILRLENDYQKVYPRNNPVSPWVEKKYVHPKWYIEVKAKFWWMYYFDYTETPHYTDPTIMLSSLQQFIDSSSRHTWNKYVWFFKTCDEFEKATYKAERSSINKACLYKEEKINENTYKKIELLPYQVGGSKDDQYLSEPIRLYITILHKTSKWYFTYTYEQKFFADYLKWEQVLFPQLKDIFEKRIPETLENLGSDFDNVVNLVE
jgi:hypothetical protein